MTLNIEKEYEKEFEIDYEKTAEEVMLASLEFISCPYEAEVNLLLTDNESIKEINCEYRNIDDATDVLSFPMCDYMIPGNFDHFEEEANDYFNPDTGELLLGDIIISIDKVYEQAEKYGHSLRREFAFLFAHSMLHLFGYDHMTPDEAADMEEKQKLILDGLGIHR